MEPSQEVRERTAGEIEAGLDKILEDLQWWARHDGCDEVYCKICERRLKDKRDEAVEKICNFFADQLAIFAGEGKDGTLRQDHQETE